MEACWPVGSSTFGVKVEVEVPKVEVEVRGVSLGGKVEVRQEGGRGEPGGQLPQMGHLKTTHAYR